MTNDIETLKRSLRESWASEKRLAAERNRLRAQMAWLEAHVFERRWIPPIGSPFTWEMVGPYRHALRAMRGGETLDHAIDIAMKLYPTPALHHSNSMTDLVTHLRQVNPQDLTAVIQALGAAADALERIQQARLTWAMACERTCTCDACEGLSNVIRLAVPQSAEQK